MMVFQNWLIIIEEGQFGSSFYFIHIIMTRMVNIMSSCWDKRDKVIKSLHLALFLNASIDYIIVNILQNISSMDTVVIRIVSISCLKSIRKSHISLLFYLKIFFKVKFLVDILKHKVERVLFRLFVEPISIEVITVYMVLIRKQLHWNLMFS